MNLFSFSEFRNLDIPFWGPNRLYIWSFLQTESWHTTRVPQGVGWCRGGNRNWMGWRDSFSEDENKFECLRSFSWNITQVPIHASRRYWSHIRDFQTDSNRLQDFRSAFFNISKRFARLWDFTNNILETVLGVHRVIFCHLVSPKSNIIGFGTLGHIQQSEKY